MLKFLAAGWKFIVIGFVAFIGFLRNLFSRKKSEKNINAADLAPAGEQPDAFAAEEAVTTEGLAADHTPAPEAGNNDTTSDKV